MSVKRTLCLVLSVLLLINFVLTVSVSAAKDPGVSPLWNCTSSVYFRLDIFDSTAYISTDIYGNSSVNNITVSIQMYHRILGIWFKYGDPITHTVNGSILSVDDVIPNLSGGTYKAELTGTVTSPTTSDSLFFESTDSN